MNKKGFTLIELLVAIAVIAILTTIILGSLGSTRSKAADNTVKSELKQLSNQAHLYSVSNTDYGTGLTTCDSGVFADERITEIRANILKNAAEGAVLSCSTDSGGSIWAVSVSSLRGGGTWCIDNSGNFGAR
ncbi:type II secretion system protein, partial [Candidatus Nomurabacteria bacterium]|nr:type II secretion system protein [Candidatus Nomurabacteria bacterium]